MKKRRLLIFSIIVIILIPGVIYAKGIAKPVSKVDATIIKTFDETLIIPNAPDKIDKNTGNVEEAVGSETVVIKKDGSQGKVKTEKLTIKYTGATSEKKLKLLSTTGSSGDRYLATPAGDTALYPSINHKQYIFLDEGNLYTLDPANLEVKQVSSSDGKELTTEKFKQRGYSLDWITTPKWGRIGSKVFYVSNRTSDSIVRTSLWKIDLESGIEEMIYTGNEGTLIGVTFDDNLVYAEPLSPLEANSKQKVLLIDSNSKSVKQILSNYMVEGLSADGRQMLYHDATLPITQYSVLDLNSSNSKALINAPDGYYFGGSFSYSPDGNELVVPLVKRGGVMDTLAILGDNLVLDLRKVPAGYLLTSLPVQWISNNTFLVSTYPAPGTVGSEAALWQIDIK